VKTPAAVKIPSVTTTAFGPAVDIGTASRTAHTEPEVSMNISPVFHGAPANVIFPTPIVLPGVILYTHTATFVPIGPDDGDKVNVGAAASTVDAANNKPTAITKAKSTLIV